MFQWDPEKAESNAAKHGVTFDDAVLVFLDPMAFTFRDPDHSVEEDRDLTVGRVGPVLVLTVSHTDRDGDVRIIGARRASPRERRRYEGR